MKRTVVVLAVVSILSLLSLAAAQQAGNKDEVTTRFQLPDGRSLTITYLRTLPNGQLQGKWAIPDPYILKNLVVHYKIKDAGVKALEADRLPLSKTWNAKFFDAIPVFYPAGTKGPAWYTVTVIDRVNRKETTIGEKYENDGEKQGLQVEWYKQAKEGEPTLMKIIKAPTQQ